MKKALSIILVLTMLLSLIACSSKTPKSSESNTETSQNTTLNETTEGEIAEFVPPENYATVLLVTINPQIRLYLDAEGNVLAVEAVNKDAKKIMEQLSVEEVHYTEAMEKIVSKANENDFIKSTTVVHIEISETKEHPVDKDEVLNEISEVVSHVAPELKLQVKVKVKENQPSEETTATISPSIEETTAPTTKPTTPPAEDPAPTQCAHTYKDATCTTPKTCSKCGATEGKAAGHGWKDATCTAPKTCTKCGATSGSAAGHSWKDGKCFICGTEDIVNPQIHFKKHASYVSYEEGTEGMNRTVSVKKFAWSNSKDYSGFYYGDNLYRESFTFDDCELLIYKGEYYYWTGGIAPYVNHRLSTTYVEFYIEGFCSVKYKLQHDDTLVKIFEEGTMGFPDRLTLEKECPNEHLYHNVTHKCTVCGKEDMVNPQKYFEPANYVSIKVDGDKLTFIEIEWDGTRYSYLESWYSKFDAENPPQGVILKIFEYEGEKYYSVGGGGPRLSFKLTDTYIEFYDPGDNLCAKFILQHDGSLRLHTDYPDITTLSFPPLLIKGSRNDFLSKTD